MTRNVHEDRGNAGNAPENSPQTHRRGPILVGAFLSSSLYALLLSTREGRKWADEQTWFTVVIGTALTLGWAAIENRRAARLVAEYFAATGFPIIFRSLLIQIQKIDAAMERAQR